MINWYAMHKYSSHGNDEDRVVVWHLAEEISHMGYVYLTR